MKETTPPGMNERKMDTLIGSELPGLLSQMLCPLARDLVDRHKHCAGHGRRSCLESCPC